MKLTLHEYETIDGVALSETQARKLRAAAGNALTVAPDREEGTWTLRAQEYVGALVVEDLHILIRPKIKPDNLFLMLEVGLPPQAWRSEVFEYETSSDLLRSIIAFFARTTETVVARGTAAVISRDGGAARRHPGSDRRASTVQGSGSEDARCLQV